MPRLTKIVATLGPASSSPEVLSNLVAAGIDVIRLNFSHGSAEDQKKRVELLKQCMLNTGRTVGVMADLQGPKIRVGKFAKGKVTLVAKQEFILATKCELGDETRVGLDYPELVRDVRPGDVLLLDDGRIVMDVKKNMAEEILCTVRHGGELSNNKGINKLGGGLSAPALTPKDRQDIKTIAQIRYIDFVAISFPKNGADMREARVLLREAGSNARIIAKIERVEAVANLDEILQESDGVMVARGDLAVEVGDAAVPAIQKKIIRRVRELNRFVITATQMMESMISSPVPTRAEASDVANAVIDGTDAVMLSAETAVGKYPVETVEAMARICVAAEESMDNSIDSKFLNRIFTRIEESIAMSALFAAHHLKTKAIAALTDSGNTALLMSRLNGSVPIYALTPHTSTRYRCSILRGVIPLLLEQSESSNREVLLKAAEECLLKSGHLKSGDLIALTSGQPGKSGGTNGMKLVRLGDY